MLPDPSIASSGFARNLTTPFVEGSPAQEVNVRFGERLQILRVQNALSQQELASRMVMPVEYLAAIEAGNRSASIVDLDGFAHVFKVSISSLLQGV